MQGSKYWAVKSRKMGGLISEHQKAFKESLKEITLAPESSLRHTFHPSFSTLSILHVYCQNEELLR